MTNETLELINAVRYDDEEPYGFDDRIPFEHLFELFKASGDKEALDELMRRKSERIQQRQL